MLNPSEDRKENNDTEQEVNPTVNESQDLNESETTKPGLLALLAVLPNAVSPSWSHYRVSPSRILRSNFQNSAAIFTKFCGSICQILWQYFSTQTSKIYTNSYMIKKFCKIE